MMPSRAMDSLSIRKRRNRAQDEIIALDKGTKRWTMSIPHDFDYDSDHIFDVVLEDVDYLLAENAQRLKRIAELEQENQSLRDCADNLAENLRADDDDQHDAIVGDSRLGF